MAMKQAAGGSPSGNHGLFHRFGIEAVSIESVHKFTKKSRRREHDLYTIGRMMEGIFRSLNNLLERFHQSFFFYLLPSTNRYVSIGMYMPGFGVLAGSMVIQALGLWYQCVKEANPSGTSENQPQIRNPKIGQVFPGWILCHIIGLIMIFLPKSSSLVGSRIFNLPSDDSVIIGVTFLSILSTFTVYRSSRSGTFGQDWKLVKCVALLEISIVAFSMSLCNFSLAYIVTLFYAPMALMSKPLDSKISRTFQTILTLLVHPLSLVFFACLVDTIRFDPDKPILSLLASAVHGTRHVVTYSVLDGYIYGNYTFVVAAVFLLPCWLLFWNISSTKVSKIHEHQD